VYSSFPGYHGRIHRRIHRENYLKWWIKVEGITHVNVKQLSEKTGEQRNLQSSAFLHGW
jgi:hypothetical protein